MLERILPAIRWLRTYRRSDLSGDLSAGLVVAVMLIPQGMAYAMLAGLPPVIGLYASTLPLLTYALFGTSRQLAVGPVAMVSLLTLSGVSALATPGTPEYLRYALLLSLMVGVMQLAIGVLRAGFLVNFLSHAVISGFTSAAAIVIGLSQLKHLLGIKLVHGESVVLLIIEAGQKIGQTNLITMALGLGSIATLVLFKKRFPRFPAPLVVVAGATFLVSFLRLDQYGVTIVGTVPQGFPGLSVPAISMESVQALLPTALTIAFVGFMESYAVAKSIASKEKYQIDANQELYGLGLANVVGSFFSASPVTGGFSRTAVNYQAGARTGLASMITAVMIVVTLLFLTPWFHYLPNAVLAAIIMVAVYGLIDVKEARHLFHVKKADGWVLAFTFLVTLFVGIEQGILAGAALSLSLYIWQSAYPHTAELGYLETEGVFRNVKRYPDAKRFAEALILRVDASLYFANTNFLEQRLAEAVADRLDLRWIVMDLSGVNDFDAVAVERLEQIMENYERRGVTFLFAGMKGPLRDVVARAGWTKKYGSQVQFLSVHHAFQAQGLLPPPKGGSHGDQSTGPADSERELHASD